MKESGVFAPDAPVWVHSNGSKLPAVVVSFDAAAGEYALRMVRSGDIWRSPGVWVTARKVRQS